MKGLSEPPPLQPRLTVATYNMNCVLKAARAARRKAKKEAKEKIE